MGQRVHMGGCRRATTAAKRGPGDSVSLDFGVSRCGAKIDPVGPRDVVGGTRLDTRDLSTWSTAFPPPLSDGARRHVLGRTLMNRPGGPDRIPPPTCVGVIRIP